jgi:Na+-translocating ferredoxin:NAD+ oxidoreductase subunit G
MKDILRIVFRLTLTCLMAATVMGVAFIVTSKAKKQNEHVREERTIYALLGYSEAKPAPASIVLHHIYRYIITQGDVQLVSYLIPTGSAKPGAAAYSLVSLDLQGKMVNQKPVAIHGEKIREREERDKAVMEVVGPGKDVRFADQTIIVTDNGKRVAYLLGGKFPGYKTFISVMLALDPHYSMMSMEILEHEEDPGLGAEIEQDYFKNQFQGKSFSTLKGLKVVKEPLPAEYQQALEGGMAEADMARIMEQYKEKDIYALTGATISSRSVTEGVKGMVKKFVYRLDILDNVLKEQQIAVSF